MLKIAWTGLRQSEKRMTKEGLRRYRAELRKQFRLAANVVRREVRRKIRATMTGGTGYAAQYTKVKIRIARDRCWATVYPGSRSRAYMGIHEYGGTVERKGKRLKGQLVRTGERSGRVRVRRGKPSTATYKEQPTYRPAVQRSADDVFRILGRSFRVV